MLEWLGKKGIVADRTEGVHYRDLRDLSASNAGRNEGRLDFEFKKTPSRDS